MYKRTLTLVAATVVLLLSACTWETPQEVAVKGSPQVAVPTGSTVFELDFLDDIVTDFSDAVGAGAPATGDSELTGGEKDGVGEGEDFTLRSELTINAPEFDVPPGAPASLEVPFSDQTSAIDLSDILGPIPEGVDLVQAPGQVEYQTEAGVAPGDITLKVALTAEWDGGTTSQPLLPADGNGFASLPAGESEFDLAEVLNARPSDVELVYEFLTETQDVPSIDNLSIWFEVPFEFETTREDVFLDFADDNGDDPLAMEDDVFGRNANNPDEDTQDALDALKGSSAEFVLQVENTTGAEVELGVANAASADPNYDPEDESNWVSRGQIDAAEDTGQPAQEVRIGVDSDDLAAMIDAPQFVPRFMVKLPYDSSAPAEENRFSINKGGTFSVTQGYLVVEADVDYTYSIGD